MSVDSQTSAARDGSGAPAGRGVTVAIPVFNEEALLVANTRRLMRHLDALGLDYQIIIGSNGSTDGTVGLGRALERECRAVEFFHLPRRGVGLAFREFVARARFPFLVSLDMDLSTDLRFVDAAVDLSDRFDIVVGSKKLATQRRSPVRRLASDAFLWWARCLTGLPYDDYSIGAKGYRVDFLRTFPSAVDWGTSYVLDLCYLADRHGHAVTCIPVACEDRRRSKFVLPLEGVYKFARLFRLWMRHAALTDIASTRLPSASTRARAVGRVVADHNVRS